MVGHLSGNDEELTNDDQKITPRVIRFVSSAVEYDKIFWRGNVLLCGELLNRISDLWKSSPFATARTRPPETRKTARLTSTTQKDIDAKCKARLCGSSNRKITADRITNSELVNRETEIS